MNDPSPESARGALRWPTLALVFGGALLLGLVTSFVLERRAVGDRVVRGVFFEDVELTGLDAAGIERTLAPRVRSSGAEPVRLRLGEAELEASALELGVELDVAAVTSEALASGREGSWPRQFGFWLARLVSRRHVELPPRIDGARLDERVERWASEVLPRPGEARVYFDGQLRADFPEVEVRIDREALEKKLLDAVMSGAREPLVVPTTRREPLVSKSEVEARLAEAENLLAGPLVLEAPENQQVVELGPRLLGSALATAPDPDRPDRLVLRLDFDKLRPAFEPLRALVERPARPASFSVDAKQRVSVVPSEQGVRLDEEATLASLFEAARASERRGLVRWKSEEPTGLTTSEAEGLGVSGLVASFTTHHPCCEARVKNIQSVARQIDGVVLRPGEQFSLNGFLGPRTNEGGYHEAPTIVRGKMKQTAGGGISQFATTLFNAVLDGGYEIIQRQPHSFYFPRYPEGHEATVSFPSPDLVFRNDTEAGLLIKTQFGPTFIRVLLYGNNGGRRVTRHTSRRSSFVEPPTEYEANPELAPEKVRRVASGQKGWMVTVSRTIHYPDGRSVEQKREVTYQPRPEVLEVHPCNIPPGNKGHTGEPCPEPPEEEDDEESGPSPAPEGGSDEE